MGVFRDPEHPLAFQLVGGLSPAAFALAVDDLLIGQDDQAGGAPIDGHLFFVGQALLVKLEEDPLGPLVVVGVGGIDLPGPVKGKAQRLELLLIAGDVVFGHDGRMDLMLDRIVFRRQAKGVPTHGVEDIPALQAFFPGHQIQGRVASGMAHMQAFA